MNSSNQSDQNHDTFEQEPVIPRRGRTPSIIVQTLNLNPEGGTSITESIELNGDDEDLDNFNQNNSNNSSTNNNNNHESPGRRISESEHENINQISEQLRQLGSTTSTTDEKPPNNNHNNNGSHSNLGSTSSLFNNNSPLRSFRPPDRPPPSVIGNRRLSLNIGSTAPRRLSLNVDSLPSFATAASLSQSSTPGSQSPVNTSGNATGSLRNKTQLKPGHSLMGWINLSRASDDLAGFGGKRFEVTPEQLAKHNKEDDCWIALKDRVYNVTKYVDYHPGGVEELMRVAGQDATELFNEVHVWVNFETILEKCIIGPYKISNNNNNNDNSTPKTKE